MEDVATSAATVCLMRSAPFGFASTFSLPHNRSGVLLSSPSQNLHGRSVLGYLCVRHHSTTQLSTFLLNNSSTWRLVSTLPNRCLQSLDGPRPRKLNITSSKVSPNRFERHLVLGPPLPRVLCDFSAGKLVVWPILRQEFYSGRQSPALSCCVTRFFVSSDILGVVASLAAVNSKCQITVCACFCSASSKRRCSNRSTAFQHVRLLLAVMFGCNTCLRTIWQDQQIAQPL